MDCNYKFTENRTQFWLLTPLQSQIRHMEKAYEGILYKTLDSLNEKLANAYAEWEKESMWIQVRFQISAT